MFDRFIVSEALKNCLVRDSNRYLPVKTDIEEASLISLLVHDIFGGEILKTRIKKEWHFYNRIDGNRVDLTSSVLNNSSDNIQFQDIPSTPGETYCYFEDEEYSNFLMRFISAFEEAVGLEKYTPGMTA